MFDDFFIYFIYFVNTSRGFFFISKILPLSGYLQSKSGQFELYQVSRFLDGSVNMP